MTRREFLSAGGAGLALMAGSAWALRRFSGRPDVFFCLGGGYGTASSRSKDRPALPNPVLIWNPARRTAEAFELPLAVHAFEQDLRNPSRLVGFMKWGSKAVVFNLKERKVERVISSENHQRFFGHGVFSPDGRWLFTSENDDQEHRGYLVQRETETFKPVARFQTYGGFPHECRFAPDMPGVLIVANWGYAETDPKPSEPGPGFETKTNLAWVRMSDGALMKRVTPEAACSVGHFHLDREGWLLGSGMTLPPTGPEDFAPAGLWVEGPRGEKHWLRVPADFEKDFLGEAAAFHVDESESRVYAMTTKKGTGLFSWNYKTGRFEKGMRFPHPVAFREAPDGKLFVAEAGRGELLKVDFPTDTILDSVSAPMDLSGTSPHLQAFDLSRKTS